MKDDYPIFFNLFINVKEVKKHGVTVMFSKNYKCYFKNLKIVSTHFLPFLFYYGRKKKSSKLKFRLYASKI